MSIRTSRWPDGVPCWADLGVPDVAAAKRFYTEVLGWSYRSTEIEFGDYTIAEVQGAAAAGIGPLPRGAPATWTLFLAGDDVDKIATATPVHGGQVLLPPHDVGTLGRMFIAADPSGARFGVWQAGTHIGAAVVNEPGAITWEDLRSPEPDAARSFYCQIFGHHTEPLADGGPDYHLFALPGEDIPLGGMGRTETDQDSAHWLVYFAVADAEVAIAAAERVGGRVISRDFDSLYGRMAELADPDGAVFYVLESNGRNAPDRTG
jgi:predicted enzyme related to lactoylglutathione lyase